MLLIAVFLFWDYQAANGDVCYVVLRAGVNGDVVTYSTYAPLGIVSDVYGAAFAG